MWPLWPYLTHASVKHVKLHGPDEDLHHSSMSLKAVKRCTECIESSYVKLAMVLSWHAMRSDSCSYWPWKGSRCFCEEQSVANVGHCRSCNLSWSLSRAHIRNCSRGKHEVKAATVLKASFMGPVSLGFVHFNTFHISGHAWATELGCALFL